MAKPARALSESEVALIERRAEEAAEQIAAKYSPPDTGGWSDIGDPIVLRYLLEGIALGLKQTDACQAAGISTDTLTRWLKRAEEQPDSAYSAFADAMKSAKAQGKRWHLQNIQRHSISEWTASAWTLERTDPEQFALRKDDSQTPKVIVQIGVQGQDVQVSVSPSEQRALGESSQNP